MVALGATHIRRLAVVAMACMVVITASCSSAVDKPVAQESSEPQKPELTQVTSSMFVDRSAVPNNAATEFSAPDISSDMGGPSDPVDPPECGPIFWGPTPTQAGSISWSTLRSTGASTNNDGRYFHLFLVVPAERPDLRSLLGKCGTVKAQGATTRVSPLPLPGLPSWALATRVFAPGADGAGIIGLCRGLFVSVAFTQKPGGDLSPNDTDALVKLFNDQVAKLEAAD
jgi:hypothetical protein